jgi:hypothetical protein
MDIERTKSVLKKYGGLLFLGLAYFAFIKLTGWSIPCPFHALTGFLCPGCGITDMFLALFAGDIAGAFAANQLLFVLGPFILALIACDEINWIKTGSRAPVPSWLWKCLLAAFTVFTIWRNLFE